MSVPNTPGKLDSKAVIDPARVLHERKKDGQHPSCSIPDGVIVCYDTALWQWICTHPDRVDCDGWLTGSHLLPCAERRILITKAAGVGAPTAAMTLEELIAFGITQFVSLGAAGGLQKSLRIGDIVVCDRAIRDEGTSHHYLPAAKYAHACPTLTAGLIAAINANEIPASTGTTWTTDAPYRETVEELRAYRAEGVATVEMEAAAVFAVGEYRGVSVSSIFTISDVLSDEGWDQGYETEEMSGSMKQIFQIALETIAARSNAPNFDGD
jgi:uridine phosphorylase